MNTRVLVVASAALFLVSALAQSAMAAPVPPLRVVNHGTRQCAEIFGGDECMDCFPPEGWESLGFSSQFECPAGYEEVQDLDYTCEGFKIDRCCSEGHSGAPGNCTDLVVNERRKQCAFVEDIANCALPKGWTAKPESTAPREWTCPEDYKWQDTLNCVAVTVEREPTVEQAATEDGTTTGTGKFPCLGAGLIGPMVLGMWLVVKRKN